MKKEILLIILFSFLLQSCIPNYDNEIKEKEMIIKKIYEPQIISKEQPREEATAFPKKEQIHNGDLIISEGTYFINNTKFTLNGNLIVNGTAKLLVTDSELYFQQEYNQQFRVYVSDRAAIHFENVKLITQGKWFNFQYEDNPKITFKKVWGEDCCIPWHGSGGNARFFITDSTIGLTLSQNVKVIAANSSLFFELVLANVTGTFELPQEYRKNYNLTIPNEKGVMEIHATNSTFTDWGTTLDKYTNITFMNSKMTIGINAGADWQKPNPFVKAQNLKTKTYADHKLDIDTNHLHLINTFVRDWYPQAFNKATLEIEDSDLADLQWSGGEATLIVRRSSMMIAIAREHVTYEIYDSHIKQDVIAHDEAKIYLYNTTVEGQIKEIGKGKVYRQ